jgi:hypothetical protein
MTTAVARTCGSPGGSGPAKLATAGALLGERLHDSATAAHAMAQREKGLFATTKSLGA